LPGAKGAKGAKNSRTVARQTSAIANAESCLVPFSQSVWSFLKDNDRSILVLFAIVGGIYTLVEFHSKIISDKELATARFVENYSSSELLKARIDFETFMYSDEVSALCKNTYDAYMQTKVHDERILRDIETQLAFFDSLSLCAISNACSQETACLYFFDDVEAFIKDTRPILTELSKKYKDPVDRLIRKFAHEVCHEQMKTYCLSVNFAGKDCASLRLGRRYR